MHLPFSVPAAPVRPVAAFPSWQQAAPRTARPVRELPQVSTHRPQRAKVRSMFRPPIKLKEDF